MEITIVNGKHHYKRPFLVAMLVYKRVSHIRRFLKMRDPQWSPCVSILKQSNDLDDLGVP